MSEETNEAVFEGAPAVLTDEAPPEIERELTLDDLFASEIDDQEISDAQKELLLPAGTYTTVPPFQPTVKKDKNNRTVIRFWGGIVMGDVTGKVGYAISHERKNKNVWVDGVDTGEDSGKPDSSYKNYVLACRAFEQAYGAKPKNVKELSEYLRDYPHRVRVIQTGNGENMVVAISAVKPS